MQNDPRAEFPLKLFERGLRVRIHGVNGRAGRRLRTASGQALDLADRHSAARDTSGKFEPALRVCNGEQGAGVAGGQAALFEQLLNGVLEPQEPKQIRDGSAVLTGALRELFLREVEIVAQALESARLLDRVQVFALEIFDQRHLDGEFLRNIPENDGHARLRRSLGGSPAALAGDQLIAKADLANDERLHDAARANRLSKLFESLFAEAGARLIRARVDQVDVDLD
jgi:hypothetical protein